MKEDIMPQRLERSPLEIRHRIAAVLAAAAMASLLIYVLVSELALGREFRPVLDLRRDSVLALRYIFFGSAAAAVVLLRILRGLVLRKRPGEEEESLGRKLLLASILTTALSEVPAILGFVLFILTGLRRDFFVLCAVSLVLLFMYFPRLVHWREWTSAG